MKSSLQPQLRRFIAKLSRPGCCCISDPPGGCSVTRPPSCCVTRPGAWSRTSILNRLASLLAGADAERHSQLRRLESPAFGCGPSPSSAGGFSVGSSCVSGGWRDKQFNQRTQQRFAPFSNIVNELKEPQVKRQFLLRNPPVRS